MITEEVNIEANNRLFVHKLQNAFAESIVLSLDTEPTFDKVAVPFQFDYSFFAIIVTNKGKFKINSVATSEGMETFWTEEVEEILEGNKVVQIDSCIISVELENANSFKFPFKLLIQFEKKEIFLYCGEIYSNVDEKLTYNCNDEMILVFDERQEAMKYEKRINYW